LRDEIGFGGFRFDFVRGFAPEYVEEYIKSAFPPETRRVEPRRKAEKKNDPAENLNPVDVVFENPVFHVGENWVDMHWEGSSLSYDQDGPRSRLVDWIEETHGSCALFDFPTKGILQRAVEQNEFWRLRDAAESAALDCSGGFRHAL
jgi:alpha-amylase